MTVSQEDALYDFLDSALQPFSTGEVVEAVRSQDGSGGRRLADEVRAFLKTRRLAFPLEGDRRWISRGGLFTGASFVIEPSRLEIQAGILVPGHRCVPFANPILLPHEYVFRRKGEVLSFTTSEGEPEDFYPFYDLFGEEYAPQYIARDNPDNEEAYNADAYEDPPEVSVKVLDLRQTYRELGFVPGDRFVLTVADWKGGVFDLEYAAAKAWSAASVKEWQTAMEEGFKSSFDTLGPCSSTEEQIAFAFWLGGPRLLSAPALSLERFLFDETEAVDIVEYGMETRFWHAGKEIPDTGAWTEDAGPPDKTELELVLASLGLPVSEYVVESYVRDAFYRNETEIHAILDRLLPESLEVPRLDKLYVAQFVAEIRDELGTAYNAFSDREMGAQRSRVAELHSAVVDLAARVDASRIDASWLPKHTFVTLSQIQAHAASMLEDLDYNDPPEQAILDGYENSLEGMIDAYEDIRDAIEEALDRYRRSRISLVRPTADTAGPGWRSVQIAVAGTQVWRRVVVPDRTRPGELDSVIRAVLGWRYSRLRGVGSDEPANPAQGRPNASLDDAEPYASLGELAGSGVTELSYSYDYGASWEVRITLLHEAEAPSSGHPEVVGGAMAPPPEGSGGALRFRRFVAALAGEDCREKELARRELGENFDPENYDAEAAEAALAGLFAIRRNP